MWPGAGSITRCFSADWATQNTGTSEAPFLTGKREPPPKSKRSSTHARCAHRGCGEGTRPTRPQRSGSADLDMCLPRAFIILYSIMNQHGMYMIIPLSLSSEEPANTTQKPVWASFQRQTLAVSTPQISNQTFQTTIRD